METAARAKSHRKIKQSVLRSNKTFGLNTQVDKYQYTTIVAAVKTQPQLRWTSLKHAMPLSA